MVHPGYTPGYTSQAAGGDTPGRLFFTHPSPETVVLGIKNLTISQRKSIFRSLIDAQDAGHSVTDSPKAVAGQYGVSEETVTRIETEGSDKDWPPL